MKSKSKTKKMLIIFNMQYNKVFNEYSYIINKFKMMPMIKIIRYKKLFQKKKIRYKKYLVHELKYK